MRGWIFFEGGGAALHPMGALCHLHSDAHSVTRTPMRGPAFGGGGRWSRDARFVRPELYLAGISGFRVVARNDERGRYILGYCARGMTREAGISLDIVLQNVRVIFCVE